MEEGSFLRRGPEKGAGAIAINSRSTGADGPVMPAAHAAEDATRPARAKRSAPVPTRFRDDDEDDRKPAPAAVQAEESSPRTTALSPNRTVLSPAPVEADGSSKRERVRKRVSDEAVGGIESLIPKSRQARAGGGESPLQSPTRNGSSPLGAHASPGANGGGHRVDLDSPMPAASKRARKGGLTEAEEAALAGTVGGPGSFGEKHLNGHGVGGGEQAAARSRDAEVKDAGDAVNGFGVNGGGHTGVRGDAMVQEITPARPIFGDGQAYTPTISVSTAVSSGPLVMWTPGDDALLRMCCESGLGFDVMASEMPFTSQFTASDLQARWYRVLYDADVAGEVAMEIVALEHDVSCPRAAQSKKGNHPRTADPSRRLASSLLSQQVPAEAVAAHGMTAATGPSVPAGQAPFAAVDGRSCHCVIYKSEFTIGRGVAGEGEELDVDLSGEDGCVGKVSRRHVVCVRDGRGSWFMTNVGKRPVYVNGSCVVQGGKHELFARSALVICGVRVTFSAR